MFLATLDERFKNWVISDRTHKFAGRGSAI